MSSRRDFLKDLATVTAVGTFCQNPATSRVVAADLTDSKCAYFQPTTLEDALKIRTHFQADVVPICGATIVGRDVRFGGYEGKRFLDLSRVEGLSGVRILNDKVEIGAATTFAFLETAPTSQSLREAAKGVGGPAIRHKATLGGNLVAARFDGDGCVAVLAMPTIVEVASLERGTRQVQIDEFFKEKEGLTSLLPDELLTRIIIPANWRTGWYEIGKREGASHSIICCAIGISPQGDVRIALGGAGPSVCRPKAAEDQIKRDGLNPAAIATAAQAVVTEVSPESNLHASADYRRAMCGVMVKRVLNELLDRQPSK